MFTFIIKHSKINDIKKVLKKKGYIQQCGCGSYPGTYVLYDGIFMDVYPKDNECICKIINSLKGLAMLEDQFNKSSDSEYDESDYDC